MGHANIGITLDTYAHLLPGMGRSAAERFDKLLELWLPREEDVGEMSAKGEDLSARLEGFEPTTPGSEVLRKVYHLMFPDRKWWCAVCDEFHFRMWRRVWCWSVLSSLLAKCLQNSLCGCLSAHCNTLFKKVRPGNMYPLAL